MSFADCARQDPRQYARWRVAILAAMLAAAFSALPAMARAQQAGENAVAAPLSRTAALTTITATGDAPAASASVSLAQMPAGVAIGRHPVSSDSIVPPLPQPANTNRGNTALMLTGAATIVVGSIVGGNSGTLIVLGGAIIGGFGLYRFLTN